MCENLILFKEGKRKDEEEKIRYIHRHPCRPAAATTNTTAPTANAEQKTDTNAATSSSTSKPAAKQKAKVKINLKKYLNKKPVAIRLSPLGTKVPGPLQDHEWG